jgi:signal transduction histidine kinase
VRKDGSRFWAHVVIDAIHDDTGELVGFAKITRDLTEKKKADDALAAADAALFQAQKMESIGQLTGGIAHDFNNLLSVLSSGLELLAMQGGDGATRTVDSMRRAVDRGARLTQQLLAFARQQPLQAETRSINASSPASSRCCGAPSTRTSTSRSSSPRTPRSAVIDSARFESALLNLVVNARDAMPDGGQLRIETRQRRPGRRPSRHAGAGRLRARDGERQRHRHAARGGARAFEPFFTTKEVGKGTGLGLSQVYGFIKQSGGEVVIESRPAKARRSSIYLPAAPNSGAGRAAPGSERVLIVEDEPDLMDMAAALFTSMGYEVVTAPSGREAIDLLEQRGSTSCSPM